MTAHRLAQEHRHCGKASVESFSVQLVMAAPKTKPELVEALLPLTKLGRPELLALRVDQLRSALNALKPKPKKVSILPANWKKGDKLALQKLYMENVVEYYKRAGDGHWLSWNRDRLLQEICMFESEAKEEILAIEADGEGGVPTCPDCGLKMIQRTNRLDGSLFYGCLRFPTCRATLPYQAGNQPTAVVQKAQKAKELRAFQEWKAKQASSSGDVAGYKMVVADDGEEMNGNALPRAMRVREPQSSSSEWEMPEMNQKSKMMTLSAEEVEMLKEVRAQKKMETKEQGDRAKMN